MKYIIMIICFAGFVIMQTQAQDSSKAIKSWLDNKQFTFQPTNMNPTRGRLRHLDPDYFLKLSGDSLISYLPYFGRAYSAPLNNADVGYDFTSTNFSYSVKAGKKNSYEVSISTKDKSNNADLLLTVFNNGVAYLRINSSNKQPISYNGFIKEKK